MESLDDQYGYNESIFISEVPDYLHCIICTLVLRDPIQILSCGHKICEVCFERIKNHSVASNTELRCPVDRGLIDLADVREDVYFRRTVGNLVVQCYKCDCGCDWQGDLRELHKHTQQCRFKPPSQGCKSESSDMVKELGYRMEQCENSLANKDKEIALLKHQLQEQQQEKEEMVSFKQQIKEYMDLLKQQLSQFASKNIEMEKKQQQEKQQQQQDMADLKSKNEVLEHQMAELMADLKSKNELVEHQMAELSQKNTDLEERLQEQQQQHEEIKQQQQRNTNNLKAIGENQQSKMDESICGRENLQKGIAPYGNLGPGIILTSKACTSGGQSGLNFIAGEQPAVVLETMIDVELHNGDPDDVTISKDTHMVQFAWRPTTVSAQRAVAPPTSKVWYEVKYTKVVKGSGNFYVGWATSDLTTSKSHKLIGSDVHRYVFNPFDGRKGHNGIYSNWGEKVTKATCVVGVALDLMRREILFSVNGQWHRPMGVAFSGLPSHIKLFPAFTGYGVSVQYNFGDSDFTFGPPDPTFLKLIDVVQ